MEATITLEDVKEIAKQHDSAQSFYNEMKTMQGIPYSVAIEFRDTYGLGGKASPFEAARIFWAEVNQTHTSKLL